MTKARADRYQPVTPFLPEMGFHCAKLSLLDRTVELGQPEALVYDANDRQRQSRNLTAVEYIIPRSREGHPARKAPRS